MQPKICTKWLHTLTWLNDVRSGVTPSTSPIPRYALYLPPAQSKYAHTHTHTYRFPFPELCFENRSFILTVNSQADRYSQSILSTIKPLSEYLRGTHVTAAPCHRGGASRIITHTRGMQNNIWKKNTLVWCSANGYFVIQISCIQFPLPKQYKMCKKDTIGKICFLCCSWLRWKSVSSLYAALWLTCLNLRVKIL